MPRTDQLNTRTATGPAVTIDRSSDVPRATVELRSSEGTRRPVAIWSPSLSGVSALPVVDAGVQEIEIVADPGPEPVCIRFTWPVGSAVTVWRADSFSRRDIPTEWGAGPSIRSVRSAPVAALVGIDDLSILTVSLSVDVRSCDFALGINEESAEGVAQMAVEDVEPTDGVRRFRLRIDLRPQHFARALQAVTDTWGAELGDRTAPVPELAHQSMYSTWYSDHQEITAKSVEQHALASAKQGCRAIIVDDGWQTDSTERGYAFCGDWKPNQRSFPDMAAHVERVHATGLGYVLWIAPALIGRHSRAWQRFKGQTLGHVDALGASVLDPRFPEVRDHIIECCLRPVRDWGVDGLKIDFVDSWATQDQLTRPGMDCQTVDEGVELILDAVAAGCRRHSGQVLIEFRQDYVGPRLWRFGTIIRAADCALDPVENRVRTIDTRLLAGDRAVHSDMLMWHPDARPEDVAAQFINVLFATPQVSMASERLSCVHLAVVRHWLAFMAAHAGTLLHGELLPARPDARYTQVVALDETTLIAVAYTNPVIRLGQAPISELIVINGTGAPGILLDWPGGEAAQVVVSDCAGVELSRSTTTPPTGTWEIPVPVAGLVRIEPL